MARTGGWLEEPIKDPDKPRDTSPYRLRPPPEAASKIVWDVVELLSNILHGFCIPHLNTCSKSGGAVCIVPQQYSYSGAA